MNKNTWMILVAALLIASSAMLTLSCDEAPPARVTGVLFQGGIQ